MLKGKLTDDKEIQKTVMVKTKFIEEAGFMFLEQPKQTSSTVKKVEIPKKSSMKKSEDVQSSLSP